MLLSVVYIKSNKYFNQKVILYLYIRYKCIPIIEGIVLFSSSFVTYFLCLYCSHIVRCTNNIFFTVYCLIYCNNILRSLCNLFYMVHKSRNFIYNKLFYLFFKMISWKICISVPYLALSKLILFFFSVCKSSPKV